ncbi:MAG: DUF6471 domain-containing protein [Cetobacterium sp.]|uniref:DUF6471 domain-containing protein n=1 Tax=Cetobacterium ceti TaxID=180163 RepID=A0A1T4LY20_9FUSO|nr:DUF6471 domain-containing protein [Cetobacterium ceti]MCJ8342390.1 DUF6471 domain-containing protein [Cetobacterium sp.]SJZ59526.1 hypothetical protein SAMN02745174_01014 [Cetobacterium ceti]
MTDFLKELKGLKAKEGVTYERLAEILKDKYKCQLTANSLANKFSRGTLTGKEVAKILSALGYEVKIEKNN